MLARILGFIRPAFVTAPILEPRMTEDEVLALGAAAIGPRPAGFDALQATLRMVEGRLVWTVGTMLRGANASVAIDDATGAVGPVTQRGLR